MAMGLDLDLAIMEFDAKLLAGPDLRGSGQRCALGGAHQRIASLQHGFVRK